MRWNLKKRKKNYDFLMKRQPKEDKSDKWVCVCLYEGARMLKETHPFRFQHLPPDSIEFWLAVACQFQERDRVQRIIHFVWNCDCFFVKFCVSFFHAISEFLWLIFFDEIWIEPIDCVMDNFKIKIKLHNGWVCMWIGGWLNGCGECNFVFRFSFILLYSIVAIANTGFVSHWNCLHLVARLIWMERRDWNNRKSSNENYVECTEKCVEKSKEEEKGGGKIARFCCCSEVNTRRKHRCNEMCFVEHSDFDYFCILFWLFQLASRIMLPERIS